MNNFEYDVTELGKLGEGFEGKYIKVVELVFKDGSYTDKYTLKVGCNVTGFNILDYALDKLLDDHEYYLEFYSEVEGATLSVTEREELENMLVSFQIVNVYLKEND